MEEQEHDSKTILRRDPRSRRGRFSSLKVGVRSPLRMGTWGIGVRVFGVGLSGLVVSSCNDEASAAKSLIDGGFSNAAKEASSPHLPRDAASVPPLGLPDTALGMFCNGAPALCDRPYDGVVFLATHQSAAAGSPAWSVPTQGRALEDQLRLGGVRAFEFEVHLNGGALALCVSSCAAGNQSLSSALETVHGFLENNPNDVFTLLVRSTVPADRLVGAFDDAGLTALAHTQSLGARWPTLREMIIARHRLVVFLDETDRRTSDAGSGSDGGGEGFATLDAGNASGVGSDGRRSWMHPAAQWMWETSPDVAPDCIPVSGRSLNPLIAVNHYEIIATPGDAGFMATLAAHDPDRVALRLRRCLQDRGRLPTLLLVDFEQLGDPNGGVQIANGLR
jgi:hypothetical protein